MSRARFSYINSYFIRCSTRQPVIISNVIVFFQTICQEVVILFKPDLLQKHDVKFLVTKMTIKKQIKFCNINFFAEVGSHD
jgi:hypothetical protein